MISFKDCASYYKGEPHQDEAWEYLQQNVTEDTLEKFAVIYRNKKVTEAEPTATSADGISLIKEFEGLRLESYYCASGILTIGYGHTGSDVYPDQAITEAEAEALLVGDLKRFEDAVSRLITVPLTQHEFDAIVSFAFNCGEGALQESTFRKRMNAGEEKPLCFKEEFIRWNKGPNGPLPGLVRRRDAEVELALS